MRRWIFFALWSLLWSLLWSSLALGGCTPSPGLLMDPEPAGASVRLEGDASGSAASLAVVGQGIGPVFGLSLHVLVDHSWVRIEDAAQGAVLGDGAVLLAHADGADLAFGGTRPSREAGEVEVADGPLATFELSALSAGSSRIELVDALARRADGSFVPLAAAGGTLTLEAP